MGCGVSTATVSPGLSRTIRDSSARSQAYDASKITGESKRLPHPQFKQKKDSSNVHTTPPRSENAPSTTGVRTDVPNPRMAMEGPTGDPFINEVLKIHNQYRLRHDAPPLRFSLELTEYSKHWAYTLAKNDWFEHSNGVLANDRIGENIYRKWSKEDPTITPEEVCDDWYNEIHYHDFSSNDFVFQSGHFTQMVWCDTREMGVAQVKTPDGRSYVVANYRPAGNVQGRFLQNVIPVED